MDNQRQDAFYLVAVCADGLVLARRVSSDALNLPEVGQPLIGYHATSKIEAASWALSLLVARSDDEHRPAG
jgi:hypothetical protein